MTTLEKKHLPYLGYGLGLRQQHHDYVLTHLPSIDWFEIMTESYFEPGGIAQYHLEKIREHYPIVMHGVSLSIGGMDPLNQDYLRAVKTLADRIEPAWISDHLCWTGIAGKIAHDLLPLPYTKEAIQHIVERIKRVQEIWNRRILIENVSSYVTYKQSEITEWEFISTIAEEADCFILLDINNIYVSSYNHQFDPITYLNHIPIHRVQQFHLAGHDNAGEHIIDSHDHPIISEVWELYTKAIQRFGKISTSIERDDNIPPFDVLEDELRHAKKIAHHRLGELS